MTFFVGPTLGFILNFLSWDVLIQKKFARFVPDRIQEISESLHLLYIRRAIVDNDFEKMMYDSVIKQMPVMFTLNSRKVYIGIVNFLPNPALKRKSVRILPVYSGYRTDDKLEFVRTVDYTPILRPYSPQKVKDDYLVEIEKECKEKIEHFKGIKNDFILRFKDDASEIKARRLEILEKIEIERLAEYKKEYDEKVKSLDYTQPGMSLNDFDIVIPTNDVSYGHFFDIETYNDFAKHKKLELSKVVQKTE